MRTRSGLLALLLLLAVPATAPALKTDKDRPADIQARTVDADERTEVALYRGRVRYVQGTRHIDAERMDVAMKDGEVELAKAWGEPARLRLQPDRSRHDAHAAALRLEYRRENDVIEMFDAVTLNHLPDDKDVEVRATADRLFYRGSEDVAELFGRVIVQQGGDVLSGGYAHYDLKTDRIVMRGGAHTDARVHAVIQPRKKKDEIR